MHLYIYAHKYIHQSYTPAPTVQLTTPAVEVYGDEAGGYLFGSDAERSVELGGMVGCGVCVSATRGLSAVLDHSGQVWWAGKLSCGYLFYVF